MFEVISEPRHGVPHSGLGPLLASWAVHALMVGVAVALPLLRATGTLPDMPAMAVFVVPAAPPPPPPPPAARIAPRPSEAAATPASAALAAPLEAPTDVRPEPAGSQQAAVPDGGFPGGVEGGVPGGVVGGIVPDLPAPPPPPPVDVEPARPQAPVRIGGGITQPRLVKRVNPVYPPLARQSWVEGLVILEATVGASGKVSDVRVIRSIPPLDQAARDAVRQWEYAPLMLNGRASPFVLTVTLAFSIARD